MSPSPSCSYYLSSKAMKKVMTGMELHIAAAAVAEVYLRLVLYRHDPSVL